MIRCPKCTGEVKAEHAFRVATRHSYAIAEHINCSNPLEGAKHVTLNFVCSSDGVVFKHIEEG